MCAVKGVQAFHRISYDDVLYVLGSTDAFGRLP